MKIMQREAWRQEFANEISTGRFPKYPNEAMLKVIFGSYLEKPLKPKSSWRVLDVGCAVGNNLIPFADLGCEIHGVDIHSEIAINAEKIMTQRGYQNIHFSEGTNQSIPYPDDYFDLILSINTLHYEHSEADILKALAEFRRVLKPGGACYLSTVGPAHEIYRRSKLISGHINLIQDFGFRNGETMFFFDNERFLKHYLSTHFSDVETGRVTEALMTLPLDFLIAVARKNTPESEMI
jgi:ubiquinone/menaquinone biosynthesis C-methylase UbiE